MQAQECMDGKGSLHLRGKHSYPHSFLLSEWINKLASICPAHCLGKNLCGKCHINFYLERLSIGWLGKKIKKHQLKTISAEEGRNMNATQNLDFRSGCLYNGISNRTSSWDCCLSGSQGCLQTCLRRSSFPIIWDSVGCIPQGTCRTQWTLQKFVELQIIHLPILISNTLPWLSF